MAQTGSRMGLTLIFIAIMWVSSSAQPPNCQPPIVSLQPCIAYITSNSSTPSTQCCTQLAGLVQTQAQCLCTFLNAAPQLPFNINRTQAITLPGACNIQAPPLSQCNGPFVPAAGSPQGSPATPTGAAAPSPASPETPSVPAGGSPPSPSTTTTTGVPASKGGSKAVPTKGQQSSSAISSTKFAPSLFAFVVVTSALSAF